MAFLDLGHPPFSQCRIPRPVVAEHETYEPSRLACGIGEGDRNSQRVAKDDKPLVAERVDRSRQIIDEIHKSISSWRRIGATHTAAAECAERARPTSETPCDRGLPLIAPSLRTSDSAMHCDDCRSPEAFLDTGPPFKELKPDTAAGP